MRIRLLMILTLAGCGNTARPSRLPETLASTEAQTTRLTFDFDRLTQDARGLAEQPYRPIDEPRREALARIDYDAFQTIRYRSSKQLFGDVDSSYPIALFHVHAHAHTPVELYTVEHGDITPIRYDPGRFDFADPALLESTPSEALGYAGFRVLYREQRPGDWLAYMGASYFRTAGPHDQYGLSARGIAVDTAISDGPEEFPRFTSFWLEPATDEGSGVTVYALLDGPSLTGAYRMQWTRGEAVVAHIEARLFMRQSVERLGIAPLTSMYWYSETEASPLDWRPEVHDSDGLLIRNGAGEQLFRPLMAPRAVRVSSFVDENPHGFGLVQRDRDFDHYQDDSVFYDKRPSTWVEPIAGFREGSVMLVEIPTDDEIYDNVVAFWNPSDPETRERTVEYRLHWLDRVPSENGLAEVVATRTGRGGIPGHPRPPGVHKFVIDFQGSRLDGLDRQSGVEPVVSASAGGEVQNAYTLPVVGKDATWRLVFDLATTTTEPIELRAYLRRADDALSETWLYAYLGPR